MKKKVILFVIIFQLFLIIGIIYQINYQKNKILGEISINPIKQEDVESTPSGSFPYFYEPKANTEIKDVFHGIVSVRTFNTDTLNERFNYSLEKPSRVFRIEAMGSSFVLGLYVNTKDNWTEVLEDELNSDLKCLNIDKFEVINLGVAGYENATTVERFKKRGQKYNPDLVLWYQTNNDLKREDEKLWAKYYLDNLNNSSKNSNGINKALTYMESFKLIGEAIMDSYDMNKILNSQGAVIRKFSNYYRGPTVMIISPGVLEQYAHLIAQISKENNYYYFDKLRNFYSENGYFLNDFHPNQKGHQMIAEDIFSYLKNSKLIPCE